MLDETVFLGVILDIYSKSDLQPLVRAFGNKVMHKGFDKFKGTYHALLEIPWSIRRRRTPSSTILKFCKLVQGLPPAERKIWDAAKFKSFDIGFDEPGKGRGYWGFVSAEAIQAAAQVGARISFTVYGPQTKFANPTEKGRRFTNSN